jgi:hypothetical protein
MRTLLILILLLWCPAVQQSAPREHVQQTCHFAQFRETAETLLRDDLRGRRTLPHRLKVYGPFVVSRWELSILT